MIILLKNKQSLQVDEFKFKCSIGKNGSTSNKLEEDEKHPEVFIQLITYTTELIDL